MRERKTVRGVEKRYVFQTEKERERGEQRERERACTLIEADHFI